MARPRVFAGCVFPGALVRWLAVPVAVATAAGLLASPAAAAVRDLSPDGPGGTAARLPLGAHQAAAAANSRVGVPKPFTRDSRTVRHANGSYTTTVFPGPVNYRTAAGWAPIDSSLVAAGEAGFAWRNKANRFTASFARHAGNGYLRVQARTR